MSRLSALLSTALVLTFTIPTGEATTSASAYQQACTALEGANFADVPEAPTQITEVGAAKASDVLPGYCRVTGYVASQVGIKLALPESWNERLIEMGCGGHCGYLSNEVLLSECGDALRKG